MINLTNWPQKAIEAIPEIPQLWTGFDTRLKAFWNEVQLSLPEDTLIIPQLYQNEDLEKTNYASTQLIENNVIRENLGYAKVINISMARDAKYYDIAHELGHIAVVTMYGYKRMVFKKKIAMTDYERKIQYDASLIYCMAIHPIIDKILKKRNLISGAFYQRKYDDCLRNITHMPIENNLITLYFIIEAKNRLPEKMFAKMEKTIYGIGLKQIMETIKSFPIYHFEDFSNQQKVHQLTMNMLNIFIKESYDFELVDKW